MASPSQVPDSDAGTEPAAALHATTLAKLNGNDQTGATNGGPKAQDNGGPEVPVLKAPRPKYASGLPGVPPNILVPRLKRPYDEHDTETTPQSSPMDSKFVPPGSGRTYTSPLPTSTSRREMFGQLSNSPSGSPSGSPLARSNGLLLNDIKMPARRSTTSDRNRPSTFVPMQPRRHTSLQYSRRQALHTGGYESSTDEESLTQRLGASARSPSRRLTITPTRTSTSTSTASSAHATHGHGVHAPSPQQNSRMLIGTSSLPHQQLSSTSGRRRAQSLISPGMTDQSAPPTPRRQSRLRASAAAGVGMGSPKSARGAGNESSPRQDGSSFAPRLDGPSLTTVRSGYLRGRRDTVREERERQRSPSSGHTEKEKRRSKRESQMGNPLTASLGLGAAPREAILSADQLQDLLGNADVASALQLMSPHHAAATPRHLTSSSAAAHEPLQLAFGSELESQPQEPAVTSPPKPFLVSAPPALTNGEWPGRSRAPSTASSFAGPSNYGSHGYSRWSASRHRTVSGSTSVDSDPMRHSTSTQMQGDDDIYERREEEEEQDNEVYIAPEDDVEQRSQQPDQPQEQTPNLTPPPTTASPAGSAVGTPPTVKPSHTKERHRVSSFFGLRKKDKVQSPPVDSVRTPSTPVPAPSQVEPPQRLEPAVPVPRPDREEEKRLEMRRAEQQRREEELAQERRYKALMQIHAHPAAQRRGQRTATHLDAYYSLIYDGIHNPPKMNPLAVLRWKKRNNEQKEARAKWEAENAKPPSLSTSASPLKPGHTSRNSFSSSYNRAISPKPSGGTAEDEAHVAPGWYYSINDVVDYNACGGRVDFFIPPAPIVAEDKHDDTGKAPHFSTSVKSGESAETRSHRPSFGSEDRGRDLPFVTTFMSEQVPPSSSSLILASEEVLSPEDYIQPPTPERSRGGSVDHGSYPRHRHAHSMSGTPQPSTLQALRALPKHLGNTALGKISSALDADEFGSRRFASESPAHSSKGHNRSQSLAHPQSRGTRERIRNKIGNIRTNDLNLTGTSEDEQHPHHFRKLIAKGQRRVEEWTQQRPSSTGDPTNPIYEEQRELEETIKRERVNRDRQMKRRPTIVELEAQQRLEILDRQLYASKVCDLKKAQEHLLRLDGEQEQMDMTLTHYLSELDRARLAFAYAADISVDFHGLPPPPKENVFGEGDEDETADELYPLRSDSETGDHSFRNRPQVAVPRTKLHTFGADMPPWPIRSVVDSLLGEPVNPIRRLELFCDRAQETELSMEATRRQATESLQNMVLTVNQLIRQKDIIRGWVRTQLDSIQRLKEERANVQLKIKGGIKPRLWTWRFQDVAIDTSARTVMSFLSYVIRTYRLGRRIMGSGWIVWGLVVAVIAMGALFYYVGDT